MLCVYDCLYCLVCTFLGVCCSSDAIYILFFRLFYFYLVFSFFFLLFFFLMIRRPPRSTRTDTLFPYTTLFRSRCQLLWSGQAPCVLALPSNHPLAVNDVVRLGELGDNTVITLSNRSGLRHRISTALLQTNPTAKPRRQIETTSSLNALMLVRTGTGVALIDPLTATTLSPEGVVFRAIDRHIPYLMGVIKHRDRALPGEGSRLVQALWDHASASVPRSVAGGPSGLPQTADTFQPLPDMDVA